LQVYARSRRSKPAEAPGAERTSGSGASAAGRARAEAGLGCARLAARHGRAVGRRDTWAAARRASALWPSPLAPPRHARTSTSAPASSMPSAQAAAPAPAKLAAARREAGHQAADAAARAASGAAEAAAPTASSVAAAAARAAAALRRPAVPAVRAFSQQLNHFERLGATLHAQMQRQVQAMLHPAGEGCTWGVSVEDPAAQGGQQRAVAAPGITSSGQHLGHDVAHCACRRARLESARRVSRCASDTPLGSVNDLSRIHPSWPAQSRPAHSMFRHRRGRGGT